MATAKEESSKELMSWIGQLKECKRLQEDDVKTLCNRAKAILSQESNIQEVHSPVTICGDLHVSIHQNKHSSNTNFAAFRVNSMI